MIRREHWSLLLLAGCVFAMQTNGRADAVLIVQGAAGETEYEAVFSEWTSRWELAASSLHEVFVIRGIAVSEIDDATNAEVEPAGSDVNSGQLTTIESTLAGFSERPPERLWIILIGHGTDDGRSPKFNLDGPDLAAEQLNTWLERVSSPIAVIHCGAASSRFIDVLSRPGRIIVTATRSPSEVNFARFGDALSSSLAGAEGDFDKDGQTSLLEAFLRASRITRQFYDGDGRLATEHALIDDNGDGRGTAAEEFSEHGHLVQTDPELDGLVASQWCLAPADDELWLTPELRDRRDQLEAAIRHLRTRQPEMDEESYYAELEPLLLEMAELYDAGEP
jgi:hypothetical protein